MSDSTTKTCIKCGEAYPLNAEHFHRTKISKDGFNNQCKNCKRAYNRQYYQDNRDRLIDDMAAYRDENRDTIREQQKDYHERNREWRNQQSREYYAENREAVLEANRKWRERNPDYVEEYNRTYYAENLERIKQQQLEYLARPEVKRRRRIYSRNYYRRNRVRLARKERARYWSGYRRKKLAMNKRHYQNNRPKYKVYVLNRRAREQSLPDTFTEQEWLHCLEHFNYTCAICQNQLHDLFGNIQPNADHWIPLSHDDCTGTIATNMVCMCSTCNKSKGATLPEDWLSKHYSPRKVKEILQRVQDYFDSL